MDGACVDGERSAVYCSWDAVNQWHCCCTGKLEGIDGCEKGWGMGGNGLQGVIISWRVTRWDGGDDETFLSCSGRGAP